MSEHKSRARPPRLPLGLVAATIVAVTLALWAPREAAGASEGSYPSSAAAAMTSGNLIEGPILWGATIGTQFTGTNAPWDWNAVRDFEDRDAAGKGLSIGSSGALFYDRVDCGGYCGFPTALFETERRHGVIPWISWQSTSATGTGGYSDADIAAGDQDSYITRYARAAKRWGHPFFLRFDWEMNGNWLPWSPGLNGNTAGDYVAMWRHVYDIFQRVGATNANFVWCPNIRAPSTYRPLGALYPGDRYVQWTCLDGYNGDNPWRSFAQLFRSSYDQLVERIAPLKPMIIGETGSTEIGGSKAHWIQSMLNDLPTEFPDIHGLLWYDVRGPGPGGHSDWPLESSTGARSAFAEGIWSPVYATDSYTGLSGTTIQAPS